MPRLVRKRRKRVKAAKKKVKGASAYSSHFAREKAKAAAIEANFRSPFLPYWHDRPSKGH